MSEGRWYRRLSVQLIALLTLALLPLGSIALFQTNRVAVEADQTAALSLLGLTERAARGEQLLIERAVGAARLFGSVAPNLLSNPETCFNTLSQFVNANPEFSFIGVLPLTGIVDCSSSPKQLNVKNTAGFKEALTSDEAIITVSPRDPTGNEPVFVVAEPFYVEGDFAGFVSIAIPHSGLPDTSDNMESLGLVELITFNNEGTILTSRSTLESAEQEMPAGAQLEALSVNEPHTFRATNKNGRERRYSIVTIDGSPAAVMAIWSLDVGTVARFGSRVSPVVFPLLMWLASMGVAMLAMHTLVLRHLRRIRRRMDKFADERATDSAVSERMIVPDEIRKLEENFERMGQEILRDEAVLENSLREKDVLVKEIHHRVKNNLQLIASIMNMQIRSAKLEETKTVLRRVQDRVLSLATIHRDLYQSQDSGRVNVGDLVTEVVEKSTELVLGEGRKLKVTMDIEPVRLFPDQAVPLSLLVAEAVTNALKYTGAQANGSASLSVSLNQTDEACCLKIVNSIGDVAEAESTGMGSQLMNAFALQLGGQIETEESDERYELALRFKANEFEPEARAH